MQHTVKVTDAEICLAEKSVISIDFSSVFIWKWKGRPTAHSHHTAKFVRKIYVPLHMSVSFYETTGPNYMHRVYHRPLFLSLYFDFFVSPVRGQRCLAISSCLVSNSIFLTYFRDRVSKTSQNMGNSKKSCSEHPTKDLLPIFWIFGGMVVFLAILFYRV